MTCGIWAILTTLALVSVAGLFALAIFWPDIQSPSFALPSGALDRVEAMAKVLTPIAILIGILGVSSRIRIADRQAESAARQAELAEEGQITERFTRAVEMLGDERQAVRLGGVYALGRVARDSRGGTTIIGVLCAFVRDWQTRVDRDGSSEGREHFRPLPEEVLAAIEVVGKVEIPFRKVRNMADDSQKFRRNLAKVDFGFQDLSGRVLADLFLVKTNFRGANLRATDLTDADLRGANFEEANLEYAGLEDVNLKDANLANADLTNANLKNAKLFDVNFEGADLENALLCNAKLWRAKNLTQDQINKAMGDSETSLPDHLTPPEHWQDDSAE